MNSLDDQHLVQRCRDGDDDAFGVLVERHQDRLFHSLNPLLRSREDAQDVAQAAFIQAYQKLDGFRGEAAFYTWLYRIAINLALSFLRRQRQQTVSTDALRESSGTEPPDLRPDNQPLSTLIRDEHSQLVRQTLEELPDEFRTVLVLKEFEGLRYDAIASLLECPIGTVRSRIHRGRIELARRLRQLLGEGLDTAAD